MNKGEKLKKLISDPRSLKEFPLLQDMQMELTELSVKIPLESAKETYSIRAQINLDRGEPIEGFKFLISNLNTTDTEYVVIQEAIDKNGRRYSIFTDSEISQLLGVLKLTVQHSRKTKNGN